MQCLPDKTSITIQRHRMNKTFISHSASLEEFSNALTRIQLVTLGFVMIVITLMTIVGNALVIISFAVDKKLRKLANYFLLSLAVSDFMIATISMPLFTLYLLAGKWTLGPLLCDIWLAQDYTCSNASFLNLLAIAADRYFSVTYPFGYRARRTRRKVGLAIAGVWALAFLLWCPWIYAWPHIEGRRTVEEHRCYVQFLKTNIYATIITAVVDFYVPVVIILVLYYKIWAATRRRNKNLANMGAGFQSSSSELKTDDGQLSSRNQNECINGRSKHVDADKEADMGDNASEEELVADNLNSAVAVSAKNSASIEAGFQSSSSEPKTDDGQHSSQNRNECTNGRNLSDTEDAMGDNASKKEVATDNLNPPSAVSAKKIISATQKMSMKNDMKAARVLTAILLAFLLTMTPYNILAIVISARVQVSFGLWNFCYFLLYVNSTLNPLCYALASEKFRRTYWDILTCVLCMKKSRRVVANFLNSSGRVVERDMSTV